MYSPGHSSAGRPTCLCRRLLFSGRGSWSSRCPGEGRWTCRCSARSSSLCWSPHRQTSGPHCLRVAFGGLRRRRFWECTKTSCSHRARDRGDRVGRACLALQGALVGLEGQGFQGFLWILVSPCGRVSLGAVGRWPSVLPEGRWRYHTPSCSLRASRNACPLLRTLPPWWCGPIGEWPPAEQGPWPHQLQPRSHVFCNGAGRWPEWGSPPPL